MAIISNLKSILKEGSNFTPEGRIGSISFKIGKKATLGAAAVATAIMLYFLHLGKAAATGALIGGTAGGLAGTAYGGFLGFQVGVALAPFTFGLSIPIATALGAALGGSVGVAIGGAAGGLIGLGMASGNGTVVSMGVGAGIGGVVGAVAGAVLGAAAVAWIPFIGPFLAPFGAMIGATIGAAVGAAVGAAAGYVVGKYIIDPTKNFYTNSLTKIKNINLIPQNIGFSLGSPISSAFYGAANFVTGLASSIWGGITSAVGNAAGWLSGVASNALGLASTLTSSVSSIVSVGVGGAVAVVGVGSILVATTNMVALSTTEGDLPTEVITPGVNDSFTIEKTTTTPTLASASNQDLTFNIKLTAKVKLTAITISDDMTVQGATTNLAITQDKNGNPISPPCATTIPTELAATASWTCQITIVAKGPLLAATYDNSTIINRVNVTATPDGSTPKTDSTSATVKIGTPPANCPSGWPTQTGQVTQGPMGHTSHGDPPVLIGTGGLEAIDISVYLENVYSTVDGTVTTPYGSGLDQRVDVIPAGCPDLDVVSYWHLSAVSVLEGQRVKPGDQIGVSGLNGTGYHTHYQFGRAFDRTPQITDYVPKPIRRDCDGDCGVTVP